VADTRLRQLERTAALGNWQDPVANAAYDTERARLGENVPPWQTSHVGWALFIAHGEGLRVEGVPAAGNSVLLGRRSKGKIRFRIVEDLFLIADYESAQDRPDVSMVHHNIGNPYPLSQDELRYGVYGQTDIGNYFLLLGHPARGSEFTLRWNQWESIRFLKQKNGRWV
jgi:hypothetical protein